ncbi:hypothetical protein SLS63_008043 [Diaporthe eres]|uniref:Nephrocystin 3-like N-terminal domain-containing protein n=1 Tax=Diaporthe eres TaxID=83184 RepID=A0ABR1P3S2_DIAER
MTSERTTTEAPKDFLPKHGLTPPLGVDEGATAPSPSNPILGNKGKATSAETSQDVREDTKDDGGGRGSTVAARPDDAGEDDGEGEDGEPKHDQDENDADGQGADASMPPRDFWKEAWDSDELGDTRRALLRGRSGVSKPKDQKADKKADQKPSHENAVKLVELVIKHTEDKMVSYKARWGSDGNETTLGKARSILSSALTVKGVLDATVQFDPTGYCSAAWAVVSFSLTLALHDKELTELTFEACAYLTEQMDLYSRIEAHYHARKMERAEPLAQALVRVYTAILVYAAEVQESTNGKARTRIKKVMQSLAQQPLEDLQEKIDKEKANLAEWQTQVDRERADEVRKEITGMKQVILNRVDKLAELAAKTLAKTIDQDVERLCQWLLEQEEGRQGKIRKSLANETTWWLNSGNSHWNQPRGDGDKKGNRYVTSDTSTDETSEDGDDRRSETSETTTDSGGSEDSEAKDRNSKPAEIASKTSLEQDGDGPDEFGDWLFDKSDYTEWVKYPQGLLWLHGSYSSSIIRNLKKTFHNDKTRAVASWYFRADYDDTKKMQPLLASLLGQLTSQCKEVCDKKLYAALRDYHYQKQLPDDDRQLFGHLQEFISKADRDIFLVLDGLDHVSERRGLRNRDIKLLDVIGRLIQREHPNLHILVISKYEKDIQQEFNNKDIRDMLVSVDVEPELSEVLGTLLKRKLEDNPVLKGNDTLRKRLTYDRSSNFHWARSVLKQVSGCRESAELETELEKLPGNIAARYKDALEKVEENDAARMKTILLWLMNQRRHLSQAELAAVVKLRYPKDIAEICPSVLVETATEADTDVFRFTHFSVKEYLERLLSQTSKGPGSTISERIVPLLPPQKDEAHFLITKRCLDILLSTSRPTTAYKKKAAPTFESVSSSTSDTDLDRHVLAASGPSRRRVTIMVDDDHDVSDHGSDAWRTHDTSADESAPEQRATSMKAGSKKIDAPARGYAAEFWFYHYRKIDSTKVSVPKLKDLESDICSKFLLDKEKRRAWLSMYDPDEEKSRKPPSAVYYAVKLELERILKGLVDGIPKSRTTKSSLSRALDQRGQDGTALQLAAAKGESDMLDVLIKKGADFNAEKGRNGTALYAAAANGHAPAVERLLAAGAKADGDDDHGDLGSPLHVAAFRGYDEVVSLLLANPGLAVDHRAGPFGTALQAACAAGRSTTVKLLLDKDADPNIVAGCFGTAAQAALAHLTLSPFEEPDAVLELLRSKEAELLESPRFWTSAYTRATSSLGTRSQHFRSAEVDSASISYATLLQDSAPNSPVLKEPEVLQQHGLANVVAQWTLPNKAVVRDEHDVFQQLLARVPFQDQLDAIKRVIPQHENTLEHLRHRDFLNKARFWAGINYILGRIPDLVGKSLARVFRTIRRHEPGWSALLSFQGVFPEFEEPWYIERYDDDAWPWYFPYFRHRMFGRPPTGRRPRYMRWAEDDDSDHPAMMRWNERNDTFAVTNPMARTDAIAMELTQQRQRQMRLEEMRQTLAPDNGRKEAPGDGRKEAVQEQDLRCILQSGVLVVTDVLELIKHLIEYGDRCAGYHGASTAVPDDGVTDEALQESVEDLTFELFSAVIRLALVLRDHGTNFEKLARPIQLLMTVRLERIKQLDALCEKAFAPATITCNHTYACSSKCENRTPSVTTPNLDMNVQNIAAAVAQQVEQVIINKFAAAEVVMTQNSQIQISTAVKEEVARQVEQVERNLEQKMQDEVQRRLAEP